MRCFLPEVKNDLHAFTAAHSSGVRVIEPVTSYPHDTEMVAPGSLIMDLLLLIGLLFQTAEHLWSLQ